MDKIVRVSQHRASLAHFVCMNMFLLRSTVKLQQVEDLFASINA